ncbi:ATP-binding protein [Methanolapillus millepedarum]|uniref:Uncharacterized protein n=1 Tax=Methanolapillus millepedarum TaxID=3028296 RepID=A0AA97A392_9EURY|nr:hypothetical protein MsAc7_03280 [Methanosarcinaceae archaeon Ac7]
MGDGKKINKILVVGLQGSGKTHLVKKLFEERDKYTLVIDPQKEHEGAPFRYTPKHTDFEGISKELEDVINRVIIPNCNKLENKKQYTEALNTIIFDEADLYFPSNKKLPAYATSFFVSCRHYMLTNVITMSRRLMDINYYIRNTADYIIAFKQSGVDDLKLLDKYSKGAADIMKKQIDYDKHNFMIFDRSGNVEIKDGWEDLTNQF